MADQKKDKPKVDVRDLKPNKDAKGGASHQVQRNAQGSATRQAQGTGGQHQASGRGQQ
jgi:hypothetical protein